MHRNLPKNPPGQHSTKLQPLHRPEPALTRKRLCRHVSIAAVDALIPTPRDGVRENQADCAKGSYCYPDKGIEDDITYQWKGLCPEGKSGYKEKIPEEGREQL